MEIEDKLTEFGIEYKLLDHPAVFTVAESMEHTPGKYPVKNLLLKEEKGERCVLVICKGDERLDTKLVERELSLKKLQFAKPDILMSKLGVEPGSASLFSVLYPGSCGLEVVIDSRLILQDKLGFHPSINTKTIFISGDNIKRFLDVLEVRYSIIVL